MNPRPLAPWNRWISERTIHFMVSSCEPWKKNPGCFKTVIVPRYIGNTFNHCKDPYKTTSIMENKAFFYHCTPPFNGVVEVPSGENMSLSCRLVVFSAKRPWEQKRSLQWLHPPVLTTRLQRTTGLGNWEDFIGIWTFQINPNYWMPKIDQNRSTIIIQYWNSVK